ncbi:hypothetical protein EDC04DRAFT_2616986 [Pisolithus marmoratus]|nr:hypothetical protein EDC04DRAFT_2616986 [Pisolithus marmoratus]
MPPKCKHNSKATANSQPITADNVGDTVESSHAKQLRADQLFDSEPVPPTAPVEHEVMWKIPSLLLKDGYLNSTCLQQVILQMPLHIIPTSMPPMISPLLAEPEMTWWLMKCLQAKTIILPSQLYVVKEPQQFGHVDICLSGPMTTQREVEDVVTQHHQCNRGLHLPDGAQLMAIHNQQTSEASHHIRHSDVEGQTSPSNDVIPAPSHSFPAAKSATSGMTSDSNSDPSQLQFYPPSVHDIIEHACDYVLEAIAECHSKVIAYENKILIYVAIYKGWWPNYTTGITELLWEDLRNWHSSLKKKACFFVHECYEWDSQNHHGINASIARKLLECGDFLKDGVDEEGHTNNLAHPALSTLIIKFFYTVALAATAIKVALDEVVAKGKEVTFKHDIYADVYADVLGLMAKCGTAPVHHAKMKVCHVQWVKVGRNGGSTGTTTGFDVDLD